ncbi:unnamed protein product [Scytosiphon promiscuus]
MSKILAGAMCLLHIFGTQSESLDRSITATTGVGALPEHGSYNEFSACQEFGAEGTVGSGWQLEDCINVWRSWAQSLVKTTAIMKENRQFFFEVGEKLRRQGTPCFVKAPNDVDGAGSRTMRYFATWVYAEEMGCDSLLPTGYRPGSTTDSILYCHRSKLIKEEDQRCAAVDWLGYFNMSNHMKPFPDDGGSSNTINARELSRLQDATSRFFKNGGFENPPWVHWILRLGNATPAGYFIMPDTWDEGRLQRVRNMLQSMRTSFRWHPRPRFPAEQECEFAPSRPNIGIHVRLGDRDGHQSSMESTNGEPVNHKKYFDKLEGFMDTVSAAALRQGGALPVFHIFSETSEPCPSVETGAFSEFLRWPVEFDQVEPCLSAVAPDDCWEKTQGAPSCPSPRSGVFRVEGKSLFLHVGLDVENTMSCMIKADGLLMGCSTFGQVAGLYSEGVRFFSVGCEGWMTSPHYKMVPPMAIAEQGSMWVPVSGSWRDPVVYSESILDVALSQMYKKLHRES